MRVDTAQQVSLFLEEYQRDGLLYMDCPECGGHNKLMVAPAKEGGHWFKCLRATCATFGTTERKRTAVPKYEPVPMTYPSYDTLDSYAKLGPALKAKIASMYYLSAAEAEVLCDGAIEYRGYRLVFPVYDSVMKKRGYVARGTSPDVIPKSLYLRYAQEPKLCWYRHNHVNGPVVVVEDQPSAVRLSPYMQAVALMGTSLSNEARLELRGVAKRNRIIILLDNDASGKALHLSREIGGAQAMPLFGSDVKDMVPEEFEYLVSCLNG